MTLSLKRMEEEGTIGEKDRKGGMGVEIAPCTILCGFPTISLSCYTVHISFDHLDYIQSLLFML